MPLTSQDHMSIQTPAENALDAFTGDLFGDIFEISGPTEKILVKKTWHTLSTNLHKIQLMQNQ